MISDGRKTKTIGTIKAEQRCFRSSLWFSWLFTLTPIHNLTLQPSAHPSSGVWHAAWFIQWQSWGRYCKAWIEAAGGIAPNRTDLHLCVCVCVGVCACVCWLRQCIRQQKHVSVLTRGIKRQRRSHSDNEMLSESISDQYSNKYVNRPSTLLRLSLKWAGNGVWLQHDARWSLLMEDTGCKNSDNWGMGTGLWCPGDRCHWDFCSCLSTILSIYWQHSSLKHVFLNNSFSLLELFSRHQSYPPNTFVKLLVQPCKQIFLSILSCTVIFIVLSLNANKPPSHDVADSPLQLLHRHGDLQVMSQNVESR